MFSNPEKFMFTTRRGKRREATLNQVLGMPTMWSDASIAHAERMADKVLTHANPEIKKGKGKYRQSNWGQRENYLMGAESMAERDMGGYEEEILGKLPKRRFKQVANPRTFPGAVSQREKARRAQADAARAHQAMLEKHYLSLGLTQEQAESRYDFEKSMKDGHYQRMRANPEGRVVSARFAGKCKATGEEYDRGADIMKVDGVGWCLTKNV